MWILLADLTGGGTNRISLKMLHLLLQSLWMVIQKCTMRCHKDIIVNLLREGASAIYSNNFSLYAIEESTSTYSSGLLSLHLHTTGHVYYCLRVWLRISNDGQYCQIRLLVDTLIGVLHILHSQIL